MNYYEARQTKDKSGWHFTCMNDGAIWPVGYCGDHEPHDTREEAEQCFHQYLLDEIVEKDWSNWRGCVAKVDDHLCDAPTKKSLGTRPPHGHDFPLCDEHRTPEQVHQLAGKPSTRIVASW